MYTYNPITYGSCTYSQQQQKELGKTYRTKQQELFPAIRQREIYAKESAFMELYFYVLKLYVQQRQSKVINYARIKSQGFENSPCPFLTRILEDAHWGRFPVNSALQTSLKNVGHM